MDNQIHTQVPQRRSTGWVVMFLTLVLVEIALLVWFYLAIDAVHFRYLGASHRMWLYLPAPIILSFLNTVFVIYSRRRISSDIFDVNSVQKPKSRIKWFFVWILSVVFMCFVTVYWFFANMAAGFDAPGLPLKILLATISPFFIVLGLIFLIFAFCKFSFKDF